MTMREELQAKKNALFALKERIKANDVDAIEEGEKLQGEIEAKTAEIEQAEKKTSLLNIIGTKQEDNDMPEVKKAETLGENFVNHLKSVQVGKRFDVIAPDFVKASTSPMTSPAAAVDWATTFDRNVVTAVRTGLVIRNLFGSETISGSTLQYLVEGAIEGAPAVTAEANEKPQVHFADPTVKTVVLSKIACHLKESMEYMNDYAFLASMINGRLLYELGLVEQNRLVTSLTGTSGIQTDSASWTSASTASGIADLILKSAMDVHQQSGFAADAIVMNPAVWYTMRVGKMSNGEYYGGGYFGPQNVPNLWGIPVCVTTAVTNAQIIVGAFKTCGSVVNNGGVSIEAVNTNEDDFVKNLMTIRAEERLALAVRRPAGFKLLTKA